MQLLYLVFGTNIQNHFQAHFSILTFLRQGQGELRITVLTDAPEFYRHLGDAIVVQVVAATTLREWEGEFKFFWRVTRQLWQRGCRVLFEGREKLRVVCSTAYAPMKGIANRSRLLRPAPTLVRYRVARLVSKHIQELGNCVRFPSCARFQLLTK